MTSPYDRFLKLLRIKPDNQASTEKRNAIRMSGSTPFTLRSDPHKSDSLTEQTATGLMGNDYPAPSVPETIFVHQDRGKRYQDFANSHLNEGPPASRIPRIIRDGAQGVLGTHITGQPDGRAIGLDLNMSGQRSGGLRDAMYIPHINVYRPAGHATPQLKTIDDNAQVPGVYIADASRH